VRAYKRDQPALELVAKVIPLTKENEETIIAEVKNLKEIPPHENLVNCIKMQIES
jgi:hypothetical protein